MQEVVGSVKETLRRTEGWLELGCPGEAFQELEALPDSMHCTREVLKLRCRALRLGQDWAELKLMGATAAMYFPQEAAFAEEWAWAEHQLGRTAEAYSILTQQNGRFQFTWRTAYYLACFSYALKRVREATLWLGRALIAHPAPEEIAPQMMQEISLAPA